MRIQADQEKCASSGQCVKTAPGVFDQRDYDGVISLLTDRPSPEQADSVRYAALICPSRAITVIEELPLRLGEAHRIRSFPAVDKVCPFRFVVRCISGGVGEIQQFEVR